MNDLISRQFVELVVEYPDPELCTYKEYRGKSYYSIKYIENGETYVGYGTYKPEVLSRYLREYFMPSAQPERIRGYWKPYTMSEITGYDPTLSGNDPVGVYCCSVCGCDAYLGEDGQDLLTDFCPNCGADMREDQDEQDNEGNV